jgi:glucans biosynthesis protein C
MDIANSTSSAFPAVSAVGTDLRHAQVMHRSAFIDNLRWSIILFVISMHAADTYWPFGNWYFADKASTGWSTALLFGTYQSFLQAFFMGLLFAVSGYFARAATRCSRFSRPMHSQYLFFTRQSR